eukprot:TRINITY_DN30455_c0_g1_i1.p1 TRINITY_DN30455_c0_g1~~TRINITY_DN30455_c0_g1_i1.p1  ORF type:complete len:622 (-),score=86.89 TRINITY_DN30455_c0_g1_i1:226-2091(-)
MGCTSTKVDLASAAMDTFSAVTLATAWPQVAAGDLHTVMISPTKTAALACGDNHFGQCSVPHLRANQRPIAVAAGRNHSVVLLDDGDVIAFGRNDDGQCLVPPFPPGRRAVAVAAGDFHTVVLLDNGDVVAFGWNGNGQCDVPSFRQGRKAVFVSAGGSHTVILLNDRSVIAFGNDTYGQCTVPETLRGQRVVAVAAGGYHTVVLLNSGRVVAFGWDICGQCDIPTFPPGAHATSVAAGESHTIVLLNEGQVIAFGENSYGQCNVPHLPAGCKAVAVAAGGSHSAIQIEKEKIFSFGQNRDGQCANWNELAKTPTNGTDVALDLSKRSISLRSILHFFHIVARNKFGMDRDATTQQVTEEIILRMTACDGSSYVDFIQKHKGTQARVDDVVTLVAHSWKMRFVDLLRAILRHATGGEFCHLGASFEDACRLYAPHLDKRYWLCIFCVNEHLSICSDPQIKCKCKVDKCAEAHPRCEYNKFDAVAGHLQGRGGSMIVAIDTELHALKRAWVMEEMHIAIQLGMRMDFAFGTLPAANTLRRYTCNVMKCEGSVIENATILARIRKKVDGGVAAFNRTITDFVRMSELRLVAEARKEVVASADTESEIAQNREPVWPVVIRVNL